MEIEEETALRNKTFIIERKLTFDENTHSWTWSSPQKHKYKTVSKEHIELLKKLLASEDLLAENPVPKESDLKSDSGISSLVNEFYEPTDFEIGGTYLVPAPSRNKWTKAVLVAIDGEELRMVKPNTTKEMRVPRHLVAHPQPPSNVMKVGCRVLVLTKKVSPTGEFNRGTKVHEIGVVAECPDVENQYRYLVALNGGWWTYVTEDCAWPLCWQPPDVCALIPGEGQEVLREYLDGKYSKKAEFALGDTIRYCIKTEEFDGGTVLRVDASLVVFWSTRLNTALSVYRGLPHFSKI